MAITARDETGRIAPGGGGRTPGSRNRRPGLVDHLPPDAFARLAGRLLEQALEGDVAAAKLLVDRYDPAPRLPRVALPVPEEGIGGPRQAFDLAAGALAAAARGEIGLEAAGAVLDGAGRLTGLHGEALLEERMEAMGEKVRAMRQVIDLIASGKREEALEAVRRLQPDRG